MAFNNQCVWSLSIFYNNEVETVSYPLTCEFNIQRSMDSNAQCTLNIYNLSPSTRLSDFFRKDYQTEAGKFVIMEFTAGYQNDITTVFRGQVFSAKSTRRGCDVITTIQAADFGHSNVGTISITFQAGTTFAEAYDIVASKLKYVQPTDRGVLEGEFKTDTTFTGTPLQILNEITDNHAFVDNASLVMLNNNEHLAGEPLEISTKTGLLEVPEVGNLFVTAKTIFNPKYKVCQPVKLQTTSLNYYNNLYKIFTINHQGTISPTVGGQRVSLITLQKIQSTPNSNSNITQQTEPQGEKVVEGTKVYSPNNVDVSNVYEYIRKNNGAIPPWKINNYVTWNDMIGHDNKSSERYNQLTPSILANCVNIANKFQTFVSTSSLKGQKFIITSGWRSKENNLSAGGKAESRHRYGGAMDLQFLTINTQKAFNNVFYPSWQGFTYQFTCKGQYYIHIQDTLGQGGARR